ncbi:MAG TPA: sodium/glutamate symporter [Longimicrobiaceae bacterium]
MLKLDLVQTVALAGVMLFVGYGIRKAVPPLARYNIPAPVIGGLLISLAVLFARGSGRTLLELDATLQTPMMVAFFTSVGFAASLSLLRIGGPQVLLFFAAASVFAVAQNLLGGLLAVSFGLDPLFGVLAGSTTLTGGPATGLAFAPLFEEAGVRGAATVAVAAAMIGIVMGGVIGGPIGTRLIERHGLRRARTDRVHLEPPTATDVVESQLPEGRAEAPPGEDRGSYLLLKNIVAILVAMWIGSWVSRGFAAMGLTLPAYIGAMLVAAAIRNLDDATRLIGLSQRVIDDLGSAALSLFIVMALMSLQLWEIAGLALPLLVILAAQVLLIALICLWPIFRLMGRDYESAVMSAGFCGFMLGTTANAMANMESLVEKYGAAPRAFLVVPIVGAFFIDFTNAVIITVFVNLLG